MGRVFQEVQRIAGEGIPVIMVEQNAKRALEISDQALVLDLGTVWMSGSGKEILDNPQVKKRYLGG
jgi:branched-chain amino acid transport system ATP-binding protein